MCVLCECVHVFARSTMRACVRARVSARVHTCMPGLAWPGLAWPGLAWHGMVGFYYLRSATGLGLLLKEHGCCWCHLDHRAMHGKVEPSTPWPNKVHNRAIVDAAVSQLTCALEPRALENDTRNSGLDSHCLQEAQNSRIVEDFLIVQRDQQSARRRSTRREGMQKSSNNRAISRQQGRGYCDLARCVADRV